MIYHTDMKALTLWQPYASAIASGVKHYETRSWATRHRGKLAIHAALRPVEKEGVDLAAAYGIKRMATGAIVAIAELVDCTFMTPDFIDLQTAAEISLGHWTVGRYAWRLGNVTPLDIPVKVSGKQGLWNWEPKNG